MAEVIIMPKLGFNMDDGQLVAWHKKVGDAVKKGEPLFDINTDKTTMPVEATTDGVVLKLLIDEGTTVPVFTPIAVIGNQGEDADAALAAHAAGGGEAPASAGGASAPSPAAAAAPAAAVAVDTGDLKLTPKAKKLVAGEGIDPSSLAAVKGTGYRGGITAKDIKASPLAKKIAAGTGVDLAGVQGTGHGGKVMAADVRAAGQTPAAAAAGADQLGRVIAKTVPYSGVRKIIGDRLAQSKFTAPHLYFTDSIDMTNFTAFRKDLIEKSGQKIAVSDFFTLAASKALVKFPDMNVSLEDGQIKFWESTNIGTAVAGDQGLIVPVIKNAQTKNITTIAKESRDLVERAKAGRLTPDEFSGGTFTISNLGMFGIENFTAIINPPESAILAVSSVRKKPVVMQDASGNDSIFIRPIMNIQLTVDHRVIDGLLAAQFVAYFKSLLENPVTILM